MHTANKSEHNLCVWLFQNMPVTARDLIEWALDETGSNSASIVALFNAENANLIVRNEIGWTLTSCGKEVAGSKDSDIEFAPAEHEIINKRYWNTEENIRLVDMIKHLSAYDTAIKLCRTPSAIFTQISKLNTNYNEKRSKAEQTRIKEVKPVSKMKVSASKVITHQGYRYQLID